MRAASFSLYQEALYQEAEPKFALVKGQLKIERDK